MSKNGKPVVFVAAGALFDKKQGAILMCQRAAKGAHPGAWEFPGGKIEKGERPEDALIRELSEEIDIIIEMDAITPAGFASYAYEHINVVIMLYIVADWDGEITLKEHQDMRWVAVRDLPSFEALPADKPLLESLPHYINQL